MKSRENDRNTLAELFENVDRPKALWQSVYKKPENEMGKLLSKGNISLNVKLVFLPEELMDYIILHEIVHTLIHNNSKRFWKELDNMWETTKLFHQE